MPDVPMDLVLEGRTIPVVAEIGFDEETAREIRRLWSPGLAGQTDEDWNLPVIFAGFMDPSRHLRVCLRCDGQPIGWLILTKAVQLRGRLFGSSAVLVEYLSVAPWCRSRRTCLDARYPRIERVGPALLGLVGRISVSLGHEGAYCFFSEEAADEWYATFFGKADRGFERLPSESDGTGFFPYYEIPGPVGLLVAEQCGIPVLPGLGDSDG